MFIHQHFKKATLISMIALAGCGSALAQSNIQCTVGPDGQLQAALVWRNTLGMERADSLCRTAPMPVVQSQRLAGSTGGYQPLAQQVAVTPPVQAIMQQNHQVPMMNPTIQYSAPQHAGVPVQEPTYRSTPQYAGVPAQQPTHRSTLVVMDDSEYVPLHSAGMVESASAEFVPM